MQCPKCNNGELSRKAGYDVYQCTNCEEETTGEEIRNLQRELIDD